jgi:hypothetical protein
MCSEIDVVLMFFTAAKIGWLVIICRGLLRNDVATFPVDMGMAN